MLTQVVMIMVIFVVISAVISAICTGVEIPILQRLQLGQNVREEGPKSHQVKAGTPSMGGVAMMVAISVTSLVGILFVSPKLFTTMLVMVLTMLLFSLVGFLDDSLKVIKHENEGLKPGQKFGLQFVISLALALYMALCTDQGTSVFVPFAGDVDFGFWYYPFIIFVILAVDNSVNLTDGLDGLASGITVLVAMFFGIAGFTTLFGSPTASIFCMTIVGACLGFLLFNHYPAKVFMGDTGSLGLGGALAAASIMMHYEILLIVAGFVFVAETASVIIQVGYFKLTHGKRFFRMAPIHHHFEEGGMKETRVVLLFWSVSFVCCIIGFLLI